MGENFNFHVLLLKKLSTRKVTQINDFPVKILKKKYRYFFGQHF